MKNNKGLSLTELLVASIIIGIVMLGVVSFNYTVGRFEQSTSRTSIIKTRGSAAMLQIKNDIAKAIGDANNPGIYVYCDDIMVDPTPDCNYCVRHDVSSTPEDYDDDQWICNAHGGSWHLRRHALPPGTPGNPIIPLCIADPLSLANWPGNSECDLNGANDIDGKFTTGGDVKDQVIKTDLVQLLQDPAALPFIEIVDDDGDGKMDYVKIKILIHHDRDSSVPVDPLDNPDFYLETRVYPSSHSQ